MQDILDAGRIPVVSTVAPDWTSTARCSTSTPTPPPRRSRSRSAPQKLVVLTDVEGVYADWPDRDSLLSSLPVSRARELLPESTPG